MSEAERVSPLTPVLVPGSYGQLTDGAGVHLSSRLCSSLVQVQAWPDTWNEVQKALKDHFGIGLPEKRHAVVSRKGAHVMPTGPGRVLIDSDQVELEGKLRSKVSSDMGAVTGLTHSRVVLTVSGPKAAWLLATGIGLDFAQSAFPVGEARLTHHHEIGLTVHRLDGETFELYAFTSYARGLWHWLTQAAAEVGYEVT